MSWTVAYSPDGKKKVKCLKRDIPSGWVLSDPRGGELPKGARTSKSGRVGAEAPPVEDTAEDNDNPVPEVPPEHEGSVKPGTPSEEQMQKDDDNSEPTEAEIKAEIEAQDKKEKELQDKIDKLEKKEKGKKKGD